MSMPTGAIDLRVPDSLCSERGAPSDAESTSSNSNAESRSREGHEVRQIAKLSPKLGDRLREAASKGGRYRARPLIDRRSPV